MSNVANKRAIVLVGGLLVVAAAVTAVAAVTGLWVLTAVSIGLLFGFFLERADLCGSSALSEVVLMRDGRKLWGFAVLIVVSMVGFALISRLGLVVLNPKPFLWANALVGGALFGVGMVLAGGCVSGAIFKAGQGNLNSMAALVAMPLGISAVAYGPLGGLQGLLKRNVVTADDGAALTLPALTHLPFWVLAVVFSLVVLVAGVWMARSSKTPSRRKGTERSCAIGILTGPWKPWQAGIAIGILASVAYVSSAASGRNYPLGVTHGVLDVQVLVTDHPLDVAWKPKPPPSTDDEVKATPAGASTHARKHIVLWLVCLVLALVTGSHVSARMRGSFRLMPKPPDEMLVAFLGGLLVGAGASLGGGCMVGNVMSGFALMSAGSILFGVVVVIFNWITTWIYLGGGLQRM